MKIEETPRANIQPLSQVPSVSECRREADYSDGVPSVGTYEICARDDDLQNRAPLVPKEMNFVDYN